MPRCITIQPHLSLEELEARYRQAKDATERTHYQIIWLLAQGKHTEEVAAITGYSWSWLYELVWGYNRMGPETLGEHRHQNPGGQEPLLDAASLLVASSTITAIRWWAVERAESSRLDGVVNWSPSRTATRVGVSEANAPPLKSTASTTS